MHSTKSIETSRLARVGAHSFSHPLRVIGVWSVFLVILTITALSWGRGTKDIYTTPTFSSTRADAQIARLFPSTYNSTTLLIPFAAKDPIALRHALPLVQSNLLTTPGVTGATYSCVGADTLCDTGLSKLGLFTLTTKSATPPAGLTKAFAPFQAAHLQWELPNGVSQTHSTSWLSIGLGLLAAVVVLYFTFGSGWAVLLPLLTAGIGVGVGMLSERLFSLFMEVPSFSGELSSMVGLGVGIDYALFMLNRYKHGVSEGESPLQSARLMMHTSGRSITLAGGVVALSMVSLYLLGINFLGTAGLMTSVTVLFTVLSTLTLFPALLKLIQTRKGVLQGRTGPSVGERLWHSISTKVQRHKWPALVASFSLLTILSIPIFNLTLGGSSAPSSNQSYSALMAKMPAQLDNSFALLWTGTKPLSSLEVRREVATAVEHRGLTLHVVNAPGDLVHLVEVAPLKGQKPTQLLTYLRSSTFSKNLTPAPLKIQVGGEAAETSDLSTYLLKKLPLFACIVFLFNGLLLMGIFRSLLIPLKALVANILSVGASFGVLTAVFQWGWLSSLFDIPTKGPLTVFLPPMILAIILGLSSDYEVFLLSRMHEEWKLVGNASQAITMGLAKTGKIITSAGLIMIFVFVGFIFEKDAIMKQFGLGLATAIGVDAFIVRCLFIPAAMEVLGKAAWWLPSFRRRVLTPREI